MNIILDNDSYLQRFCPVCLINFNHAGQLDAHMYRSHKEYYENQTGSGIVDEGPEIHFKVAQTALNGQYIIYKVDFDGAEYKDIDVLFAHARQSATRILEDELKKRKNLKLIVSVIGEFTRINSFGETEFTNLAEISTMRSFDHLILHRSQIPKILETANEKIGLSVEEYIQNSSGWSLDHFTEMAMKIASSAAFGGSSFMELPTLLKRKRRSLINIRNDKISDDNDHSLCFAFSVLAHPNLAGIPKKSRENERFRLKNRDKVSYYKPHLHKLTLTGLKFPLTVDKIKKFEKLNPRISITVIGYDVNEEDYSEEDNELSFEDMQFRIREKSYPLYKCKENREIKVDLLLLVADSDENESPRQHFVYIQNLVSLLSNPENPGVKEICRNCIQTFQSKRTLDEHQRYCASSPMQKTTFPLPGKNIFKFKSWDKTIKLPYIFFCDFESLLPKYEEEEDVRARVKKTTKTNLHVPICYSWVLVDSNSSRIASSHYRASVEGENVVERFLAELLEQCESLKRRIIFHQKIAKKVMNFEFPTNQQTCCFFCEESFPDSGETDPDILKDRGPVRHHSHTPPFSFLGYAHNTCNLLAKVKTIFPCVIHNLGAYDANFIVAALNKSIVDEVEILGKTSERFFSILVNKNLHFLDSFNFFPKSLSKLVEALDKDDEESFKLLRQEFGEESTEALARQLQGILPYLDTEEEKIKAIRDITGANLKSFPAIGADINLLLKKQPYPYSYMTSVERFDDQLPPPSAFWNDLTDEGISEEDYLHLQKVWKEFNLKSMGDLTLLYVTTDTLLLASVFESNRRTILKHFQLDLAQFLSLPMLTKSAAFKKTKAQIELLTDSTKFLWLEKSIRGGLVSTGSMRTAKSNNPFLPEYNKDEPTSFLTFLDANALYAHALSEPLPKSHFNWVDENELERIRALGPEFILNLKDEDETGYFFEIDLIVPENMHEFLDDFPPAATHRFVERNQLSPYQNKLMDDLKTSPNMLKTPRLIADLLPKLNYICHYRNLKYYLILGCRLLKIHKILSFKQSRWFKTYIDFNTEMRKNAKSEIERDLWKLLSNSAFGKFIESIRRRNRIIPIVDEKKAIKFNRKPTVLDFRIVHEGLVILLMKKLSVRLNNAIAVGSAVLELSKLKMLKFFYEFIKVKYGPNSHVCYGDTDSLLLYIVLPFGGDIYEDFKKNEKYFDMSCYDKDSPIWGKYHSDKNRGICGLMKDELGNAVITHAVIVRPKVYIIRYLKAGVHKLTGARIFEPGSKKKAKGISKNVVEKTFDETTYMNAMDGILNDDVTMRCIRSYNHVLYTITLRKQSLTAIDVKRYCNADGTTFAFGNKNIKE